MKNIKFILVIILITTMTMLLLPNITKATSAMDALGKIEADTNGTGKTEMTSVVNKLLGFLQIASALIAVVMIAVTGFRYIIETPEMKNELKKSMIPIIVGILLVFFAASIAKFFIGMFSNTKRTYTEYDPTTGEFANFTS